MVINSLDSRRFKPGDCLDNLPPLKFRLSETSGVFENKIEICFVGYQTPPGFPVPGVAPSKDSGKGDIYLIISVAEGPQGTRSRIEAVYTP